jgi:hypothetical protein
MGFLVDIFGLSLRLSLVLHVYGWWTRFKTCQWQEIEEMTNIIIPIDTAYAFATLVPSHLNFMIDDRDILCQIEENINTIV